MSMFATPGANGRRPERVLAEVDAGACDDLFDATPWRGKERELSLPPDLDFGSAIKLETSVTDRSGQVDSDDESAQWKPRAGMSKYVQDVRRAAQKPPQNRRDYNNTQGGGRTKELRERLDEDGINMDVRLTPGGTLNFKCLRDDNVDDFFDDYYGAEEDELSSND